MNAPRIDNNVAPPPSHRLRWVLAAATVIALATSVRLVLNLRHELAPGTDAAYYPMQTRWLLEHGELQLRAMPLIFWLDAFAANVLMSVTSLSNEDAIALACRLVDSVCQPWVVVPIMLLGYRWSTKKRTDLLVCAACAVMAVLSPPIMRMASDLQKNSLGLVWMAFCVWAMREALANPKSVWRWMRLATFFVLSGITHIGAFGVTCVVLGATAVGYAAVTGQLKPTKQNLARALLACLVLVVLLSVVYWFVPDQMQRTGVLVKTVLGTGFSFGSLALAAVVYGILIFVLRKLWALPDQLPHCDFAIAFGTCAGLAMVFAPMLSGTWAMRFQIMGPVPAALLLMLLFTKSGDDDYGWKKKALFAAAGLLAVASPLAMQGPQISPRVAAELRTLKASVENPKRTLIVAPHGIEFWVGHLMHTHVAKTSIPENLSAYDKVLVLQPKEGAMGPGAERFPPPPHRRPPDHFAPREPPPHKPNDQVAIPEGAREVYQSEFFTLYEVPQ